MSTSHLDRKELKRPDAFLERAGNIFHYINENAKTFLAGLALLLLLGMGVAFYNSARTNKMAAANTALFIARKAVTADLENFKRTPTGTWELAAKGSLEQLEKVAQDSKGMRAGYEAYLTLGDIYSDKSNSNKAAEYYRKAVDSASSRPMKALAQHSLAYAYEDSKQYDLAIEMLRQVLASGDKALKSDALMALARNFELKGDKPRALEQYDLIIKEFPNTPTARTADINRNNLR